MSSVVSAGKAALPPQQRTADITQFLQDIIGRDQVLAADSGRLREIHARIVKEVEDTKKELHTAVRDQWPTLESQYETTIELSRRLKDIQTDVDALEHALDGEDSSLRPRLVAQLAEHTKLSVTYTASKALIDLLESLNVIQNRLDGLQALLDQGRLEDAPAAIQELEKAINVDTEAWKQESAAYRGMKECAYQLRAIALERLQEALQRCASFDLASTEAAFTVSSSTIAEPQSANHRLSLQYVLLTLAQMEPLESHFSKMSKLILSRFIEPLLISRQSTFHLLNRETDDHAQVLTARVSDRTSLRDALSSLETLLRVLAGTFRASDTLASLTQTLFLLLVPPIQQLIIDNILLPALPLNPSPSFLESFQETCAAVAEFEGAHLTPLLPPDHIEAQLRDWIQHAGTHWSRKIVESVFERLRIEISKNNDYWNKTEYVEYREIPEDEEEKGWQSMLHREHATQRMEVAAPLDSPPRSTTEMTKYTTPVKDHLSAMQPTSIPRQPSPIAFQADEAELEEDAWGLEEGEAPEESQSVGDAAETRSTTHSQARRTSRVEAVAIPSPQSGVEASPATLSPDMVESSPALDVDNAWGFDEDVESETAPAGAAPAADNLADDAPKHIPQTNGPLLGGRSEALEAPGPVNTEDGGDEEAGGWSFDDEAEEEAPAASDKPSSVSASSGDAAQTPQSPTVPSSSVDTPGHSRRASASSDDWEAWNKEIASKPIKVVKNKRLGGGKDAARQDSAASTLSGLSSLSSSTQSALPRISSPEIADPKSAAVTPAVPLEPPPIHPRSPERMMISSKARSILDIGQEILRALLAVAHGSGTSSIYAPATSGRLVKAYADLYDLYRAVIPTLYSELISTVPSIGVQFSNDLLFLHRDSQDVLLKALSVGRASPGITSIEAAGAVRAGLEKLKLLSGRVLEEQIELQRTPLMEALDEADGFKYTDDPAVFRTCQRAVRGVVMILTRISHAWKPVLRPSVYLSSLGILTNAVLFRVLIEIENQDDISEESSLRLNDLCKLLHELEGLFVVDDAQESSIASHVPVWFKFKFLSELLEASMADIMFLFNEGHLIDFSANELSKLIRALFADSALRTKNLEIINGGQR